MPNNRLSNELTTELNVQMTKEATALQIYLSYAMWVANGIIKELLIFYSNMQMKNTTI
jgi:ferritin